MRAASFFLFLCLVSPAQALNISDREAQDAGARIWRNECSGRVDGLTSWNSGEDFASLGIGHFIWYTEGRRGPFDESFPKLLAYLKEQKVPMPAWLAQATSCPWTSREAFLADFHGERMTALRQLLASTVAQQARFIVHRLEGTLPLMLEAVPEGERAAVRQRFELVADTPGGVYPLVDYVNFKGEGWRRTPWDSVVRLIQPSGRTDRRNPGRQSGCFQPGGARKAALASLSAGHCGR